MSITADIWECPHEIKNRLQSRITNYDVSNLAIALEDCVSMSWSVLAECYFRLTPGKVETIRADKPNRDARILEMLHAWVASKDNNATFEAVGKILDEAKLVAAKHRWWNCSRDSESQNRFKQIVNNLHEFINHLVNCGIKENEWTDFLFQLNVRDKEEEINKEFVHVKIQQRLRILQFWEEKNGYGEATIKNLKDALKRARLRRVVCQIAGSEVTGPTANMNERFTHFMEDEWDKIFSLLEDGQKNLIYEALRRDDPPHNSDEAFDVVIRDGNKGFYAFIKALFDQANGNIDSILDVLDRKHKSLFNLKKVSPVAPHFKKIEAFTEMEKNVKTKRFVALHGLPGSGKSQCVAAYAKQFINEHPLSIVWFLDCRSPESQNDALLSFRTQLLEAEICTNNKQRKAIIKGLVEDIKSSDMHVLLVLEDVYEKIQPENLLDLLKLLEPYKKAYVLATARKQDLVPKRMFFELEVCGFTRREAEEFLLPPEKEFSDEEKDAAKEIASRYSYLPLGLAPAKAYCEDQPLPYSDYLTAMDEEMEALKMIKKDEDNWLKNFYATNSKAGKNILATMILALNSLEKLTLSSRTIDFQDLFSHAVYFHHEKIPIYLFKQLIMQQDICGTETVQPVSDVLCKLAINKFRHQLKVSSIGVVDEDSQTISTHRVVLLALKHLAMKNGNAAKSESRFTNALFALACYFQKDNRLVRQHNQLLALMPHVSHILSKVKQIPKEVTSDTKSSILLEDMLVIRLQELRGFTCTQSDAVADAYEPLKRAYDRILWLLCNAGGITVDKLEETVDERVLEGNGPDTYLKTKARVLTQFCKQAVDKMHEETFDRLIEAVIVNEEDLNLFKRNCTSVKWETKTPPNVPLTAEGLKLLRDNKLALSKDKLKSVYLAEQLSSILYTRGRLMFYNDFSGNKEEYINYLKLSCYITKEVVKDTGIRLLHLLISDTNGLLYLKINADGSDEEKKKSYREAYKAYEQYCNSSQKYHEHGILKEDGKTDYNQMRCYRQMIKANHKSMQLPGSTKEDNRFEVCRKLMKLVHDHPQYAKTAVDSLVESGDFCWFGEKYDLALDFFREVLDRIKDHEDNYYRAFRKAILFFSRTALKLLELQPSDVTREYCKEAKQRCEKALVLIPRNSEEFEKNVKALIEQLEPNCQSNSDVAQNDAKKRKVEKV